MRNLLLIVASYFILSATNVIGQEEYTAEPTNPQAKQRQNEEQRKRELARQEASRQRLQDIQKVVSSGVAPKYDPNIQKTIQENAKAVEKAKKMVMPTSAQRQKYRTYLKSGKTELAIIFPDINCEAPFLLKTVSVEDAERCADALKIQKNGSLYSFKSGKNYVESYELANNKVLQGWWDVHFVDQNFVVGNCCKLSLIADLGNADIESLGLNSPGLNYLNDFKAPTTPEKVRYQNELLNKGIKFGDYIYRRTAKAHAGHTYAVLSVAYNVEQENADRLKIEILSKQITAFKVLEVESNGVLILLWKNLLSKN